MGRWVKRGKGLKKPEKVYCEICGEKTKAALHYHHIIPRTEENCFDDWANVCVICANCHNKVHDEDIEIIGVFPSTKLPYKRTLIFKKDGESNVPGIDNTYYKRD